MLGVTGIFWNQSCISAAAWRLFAEWHWFLGILGPCLSHTVYLVTLTRIQQWLNCSGMKIFVFLGRYAKHKNSQSLLFKCKGFLWNPIPFPTEWANAHMNWKMGTYRTNSLRAMACQVMRPPSFHFTSLQNIISSEEFLLKSLLYLLNLTERHLHGSVILLCCLKILCTNNVTRGWHQ